MMLDKRKTSQCNTEEESNKWIDNSYQDKSKKKIKLHKNQPKQNKDI